MASKKQTRRKAARRRRHQEKTRRPTRDPIPDAMTQLRALQTPPGRVLEACHKEPEWIPWPAVRVRLDTAGIDTGACGLAVGDTEEVYVAFGDDYPNRPPGVFVDHVRFVGFLHVIRARPPRALQVGRSI